MDEVRLREVIEQDLPELFEHQRDPESNRMAAFPPRDREAFTAHWAKIFDDSTVTTKTILLGDRVAGNILSWEPSPGRRVIGYWIGKEFWGQGVASRALAEFLRLVPTRPLYAHVAKHNAASLRVLEKCGFTIEGEGKVHDERISEEIEEFVLRLDPAS
jgi:RimJ/RimL family protein N-acetyltransferase